MASCGSLRRSAIISLNDEEINKFILALEEGGYYDSDYTIIRSAIVMLEEKVKEKELLNE